MLWWMVILMKFKVIVLTAEKMRKDAVHEIFITMEHIMEEFSNMNPMLLYDLEKFHFRSYQRFKNHKDKFLAANHP